MTESSQQETPGTNPDIMSQMSAAAITSPDHPRLPPNPLAQSQQPPRDWEASFKGLNTRYQEDRQEWEKERTQLGQALKQMADRLAEVENTLSQGKAPAPKPQEEPPAPKKDEGSAAPNSDEVYEILSQMEAERYRDNLLLEMSQPGQPGEGLDLFMFRENIPAHPLGEDDDGNVDDGAQRKAVEAFIKRLKGIQAKNQQQAAAGWTPGSSPGAPRPETSEDKMARYEEVAGLYASPEFDTLSPSKQAEVQNEYYDLIDELGSKIPGVTQPWMDLGELQGSVQKLMGQMGLVMDRLKVGD